ncbi:MAG: hypothetical protein RR565_00725 [Erysipelothrix sp.]
MKLRKNATVLFIGDHIIDDKSEKSVPLLLREAHPEFNIVVSSHDKELLDHLVGRIKHEVKAIKPDLIILSVGISDSIDQKRSPSLGRYEEYYRFITLYEEILSHVESYDERVVILEPFMVVNPLMGECIRFDLDRKLTGIRRLVRQFGFSFISLDGPINAYAINNGIHKPVKLNGVTPRSASYQIIADSIENLIEIK